VGLLGLTLAVLVEHLLGPATKRFEARGNRKTTWRRIRPQ
jgi:hypothetical protein